MTAGYFIRNAQDLRSSPVEVIGEALKEATVLEVAEAMARAYDSPEAFERAYKEDSCAALEMVEIELVP